MHMGMKLGCCIGIEYYDLVAKTGYDTITLPARDIARLSDAEYREVQKKVADGPLGLYGLNAFSYPQLRMNGSDFSLEKVTGYAASLLERAAGLKVRYIGIGGPLSRNVRPGEVYAEAMAQFKTAISAVCRLAQPYGIDVLLEAVTTVEGNFLTTVREAMQVTADLGLPNLHLVYDIYHEYMESQPLDVIGEASAAIKTVHLAQNVENSRHYLDRDPGHMAEYRAYLAALQAIGYTGEVSMESLVGDPAAGITKSYPILKEILQQLGG